VQIREGSDVLRNARNSEVVEFGHLLERVHVGAKPASEQLGERIIHREFAGSVTRQRRLDLALQFARVRVSGLRHHIGEHITFQVTVTAERSIEIETNGDFHGVPSV
jgi:hypothetical protein